MDNILKETRELMNQAIENMNKRLNNIRTGRANPAMLDHVMVEAYGAPSPIKNIATISIPEARQLLIRPFDKNNIKEIETAIMEADLGIMPTNTGDAIILTIPPLTEERRKEFVKEAKSVTEEGKIAIRNIRQSAIKDLEKEESSKDMVKSGEKLIQDLVDEYNKVIDQEFKNKEKDLLLV
jgi:ribosome recycling factor